MSFRSGWNESLNVGQHPMDDSRPAHPWSDLWFERRGGQRWTLVEIRYQFEVWTRVRSVLRDVQGWLYDPEGDLEAYMGEEVLVAFVTPGTVVRCWAWNELKREFNTKHGLNTEDALEIMLQILRSEWDRDASPEEQRELSMDTIRSLNDALAD